MIKFDEEFWLAISFLILVLLSIKHIKIALVKFVAKRQANIENRIDEARNLRIQAENLYNLYKDKYDSISSMRAKILSDADEQADSIKANNDKDLKDIIFRKNQENKQKIENYKSNTRLNSDSESINLAIEIIKNLIDRTNDSNLITQLNLISINNLKQTIV